MRASSGAHFVFSFFSKTDKNNYVVQHTHAVLCSFQKGKHMTCNFVLEACSKHLQYGIANTKLRKVKKHVFRSYWAVTTLKKEKKKSEWAIFGPLQHVPAAIKWLKTSKFWPGGTSLHKRVEGGGGLHMSENWPFFPPPELEQIPFRDLPIEKCINLVCPLLLDTISLILIEK